MPLLFLCSKISELCSHISIWVTNRVSTTSSCSLAKPVKLRILCDNPQVRFLLCFLLQLLFLLFFLHLLLEESTECLLLALLVIEVLELARIIRLRNGPPWQSLGR